MNYFTLLGAIEDNWRLIGLRLAQLKIGMTGRVTAYVNKEDDAAQRALLAKKCTDIQEKIEVALAYVKAIRESLLKEQE